MTKAMKAVTIKAAMPVPLGLRPSFGFGDRLGLATPGHVAAMQRAGSGIAPIYPQQSIREMTRTNRSPEAVMADAVEAAAEAGWTGDFGADADHLKTPADVDRTAAVGFTFFTIDPSDDVDAKADNYPRTCSAVALPRFAARSIGTRATSAVRSLWRPAHPFSSMKRR